jgi:hypothetical protein
MNPEKWPSDKSALRDTYSAYGFVVLESFFGEEEVTQIRANLQRYIDAVVPNVPPMDVFYENKDTKNDIRMCWDSARESQILELARICGMKFRFACRRVI